MELNLEILNVLKRILRQSDRIIELDIGEFIVLCPYTPQQSSQIVENKINDTVVRIVQSVDSVHDFNLYATNFPERVQSFHQLESIFFNGTDRSSG